MKSTFLLYFIIIFINSCRFYAYRCGADSMKLTPHIINNDKINTKINRRLSTEYTPIKIVIDYTQLSSQISPQQLDYYKEIFTEVTNYFNSLLNVQHDKIRLNKEIVKKSCDIDSVGNGVNNYLYDNDVVIFPYIDNSFDEDILAAASVCLVLNNNKPVGGIVGLNRDFTMSYFDSKEYMEMILLHELTHVLVFSPYFFESLNLKITETRNGKSYFYINSPKVLEKAKIHFNCENIKGIQLEDQGGEGTIGAHWESRYMLGDYMISSDYTEIVISEITLALFEDSGFYQVNYYTGGLFRFGKNQGCAFLEESCINNQYKTQFPNEFCFQQGKNFCGSSHISKGVCFIKRYQNELEELYQYFSDDYIGGGFLYTNYCPISYFQINTDPIEQSYYYPGHCKYGYAKYFGEKIGSNSLCFESSLKKKSVSTNTEEKSVCYEIECDKFEKQIIIKIEELKVICPGYSKKLKDPDGFLGEINCPDYNLVCSSKIQCNDMLDCINKKSIGLRSTYFYIKSNKMSINYFLYFLIIVYLL